MKENNLILQHHALVLEFNMMKFNLHPTLSLIVIASLLTI